MRWAIERIMVMNPVHLHLMLNHLPVLGVVFAILLFLFALIARSEQVKRIALTVLVVAAVFAVPVFLTGEPSEEIAESLPGVAANVIEEHEDAAKIAFGLILAVGAMAAAGLWAYRAKAVSRPYACCLLVSALVAGGALVWTANRGGKVRHTELRSDTAMALPAHHDED
jgi:uncharacterized membrane protein